MININTEFKEFKEFMFLEEAVDFGAKYFGDWLKEFQAKGKLSRVYELSDFEYGMIKEEKGQEHAERIKYECLIYKDFSYYCGGNYGLAINELCRYGYSSYLFKTETLESMIQTMDSEINKYEVKENIVAYRTFSYSDLLRSQEKEKINRGDIIVEQGFMGVGLVKEKLLEEHKYDTIMKVFVPVGCHAIYLDLISRRVNEQELLFKRGTKLKVIFNKKTFFGNERNMICVIL
ncbi:ADP-ribosyltransferase [Clostridium tagluense]|uniref:ADP-ribosyltransferase n=1 Tax=Clostridium tagluense TaxID=360422 RepID=UPI001CF4EDE3|nr:ADP-ribosyltransferase [Clostridium tagluense]MCB2297943.1 ADP-ribosyltransferase [Clostridium tagluense]